MKISVVIPTANRHSTILKSVRAVLDNTIVPYELIVIDQSQNDLTLNVLQELILHQKITYIKDSGTGAARSRNIGWRHASGEIIAFTDDDAIVHPKWLESIRDTFKQENLNIGILSGKVLSTYEERDPNWNISPRLEYILPAYNQGNSFGYFAESALPLSVNFSIYRSLLEKFSGFDESLGPNIGRAIQIFGEDSDLALRLKKNGFFIFYNPDCIVYHPVPLERQNLNFIGKRLKEQGATNAYLELRNRSFSVFFSIQAMLKKSLKAAYLLLTNDFESKSYLYGQMYILFKCGILRLKP